MTTRPTLEGMASKTFCRSNEPRRGYKKEPKKKKTVKYSVEKAKLESTRDDLLIPWTIEIKQNSVISAGLRLSNLFS